MSPNKLAVTMLVVALAATSAGCFGQSNSNNNTVALKKSKSPLSFFSRKKKSGYPENPPEVASSSSRNKRKAKQARGRNANRGKNNVLASAEVGNLSPESSIQRDLEKLRTAEKKQVQTLAEMRKALSQGSSVVAKEEQKLQEIRGQIKEYELAMRRYDATPSPQSQRMASSREMASYENNDDDSYVVPTSMYADPRSNRGGRGGRAEYARQEPPRRDNGGYEDSARTNRYASYEDSGRRDDYAPNPYSRQERGRDGYSSGREEVLFDGRNQPQPQAGPQRAPTRDLPPARAAYDEEGDPWSGGGALFSRSSRPQAPEPLQRNRERENQGSLRPSASQPAPQRPRQAQAPVPVSRAPVAAPAPSYDDEVFTPDMFLSGGR